MGDDSVDFAAKGLNSDWSFFFFPSAMLWEGEKEETRKEDANYSHGCHFRSI